MGFLGSFVFTYSSGVLRAGEMFGRRVSLPKDSVRGFEVGVYMHSFREERGIHPQTTFISH